MLAFILALFSLWAWVLNLSAGTAAEPSFGPPPALEVRFPYFSFPDKVSFCGEPVPLGERRVREALDREFTIVVWSRAQTTMWLKRAHRYFPEIESRLKARHLPLDLKYVALIESDLRQEARSHAGALGPWQFISPTAQRFQLKVTPQVDERLDFSLATEAALTYLTALYQQFGSWALALAAYNCGENRIQRELTAQGVKSYYHLDLPEETERYVYRAVAAKIVLESPKVYGYDLPPQALYEPLEFDEATVVLTQEVMVRSLAAACGTYYKDFRELNPWVKGASLPPGSYRFRLPKGSKGRFVEAYRWGKLEVKGETPPGDRPRP